MGKRGLKCVGLRREWERQRGTYVVVVWSLTLTLSDRLWGRKKKVQVMYFILEDCLRDSHRSLARAELAELFMNAPKFRKAPGKLPF